MTGDLEITILVARNSEEAEFLQGDTGTEISIVDLRASVIYV